MIRRLWHRLFPQVYGPGFAYDLRLRSAPTSVWNVMIYGGRGTLRRGR